MPDLNDQTAEGFTPASEGKYLLLELDGYKVKWGDLRGIRQLYGPATDKRGAPQVGTD